MDEEKLAQLVGKGFTIEFVADFFGVNPDTLYANYSETLRKGYAFRNGCLQAKQVKEAMKGNTSLLIWLGKQWLKQNDKTETEVQISFDGPRPQRVNLLPEKLPNETVQ